MLHRKLASSVFEERVEYSSRTLLQILWSHLRCNDVLHSNKHVNFTRIQRFRISDNVSVIQLFVAEMTFRRKLENSKVLRTSNKIRLAFVKSDILIFFLYLLSKLANKASFQCIFVSCVTRRLGNVHKDTRKKHNTKTSRYLRIRPSFHLKSSKSC